MADYPSISFSTKTKLPVPAATSWRRTIGVVGEFSRGPTNATVVDPREFVSLFGVDGSSGSVAVQQALSVGAAEFVISRAIPADTRADTVIHFASQNARNVPPVIANELLAETDLNPIVDLDNYTTGLELAVNYVGSPLVRRTIYGEVDTLVTRINHPSFKSDQANLTFFVVDFKQGGDSVRQQDAANRLILSYSTATQGQNQIITFASEGGVGHNIVDELPNLKPGYRLTNGTAEFLILAAPYDLGAGLKAMLVETLVDSTGADNIGDFVIKDPDVDRYVIGYTLQLVSGRGLQPYTLNNYYYAAANGIFDDGYNENRIHSYYSLKANEGGLAHLFQYDVSPSSTISGKIALNKEHFGNNSEEGIYLFYGQEGVSSTIQLALKGQYTVPFAVGSVMVGSDSSDSTMAFNPGDPLSSIIRDFQAAIYSDLVVSSLINEVETAINIFPYTLSLHTALTGAQANRVYYRINRYVKGTVAMAGDLEIKVNEDIFDTTEFNADLKFSNAFSGPRGAFRDYYSIDGTPVLRINAVSPGVQEIRVTLVPDELSSSESPTMTVQVNYTLDGIVTTELGQLRMGSIDPVTGAFQNTGLERVSAYFIPLLEPAGGTIDPRLYTLLPLRSAPPLGLLSSVYNVGATAVSAAGTSAISNLPLVGGVNFRAGENASLVETRIAAYREAVRRLAGADIAFLVIAGLPYGSSAYSDVFAEAIEQAKRASSESGLRQVFFETPFNMSPKQSAIISGGLNNEFVTLVNGNVTMALDNGTFATRVGVTGYYAGLLATRPPHISPHANYGGQFLQNVLNSTSQSDPDSKNMYTRGRVDSLHFDRGLNRWKFLNGLTTSKDDTKRYVSVVRLRLQLMSDLHNYLQWVLSEPNTRALQRKVETSVEAYMNSRLQEGWLLRLGPVVCNETNNTETDMVNGRLFVDINYVPVVPADFIFVAITEDYNLLDSLEFTTQPAFNA